MAIRALLACSSAVALPAPARGGVTHTVTSEQVSTCPSALTSSPPPSRGVLPLSGPRCSGQLPPAPPLPGLPVSDKRLFPQCVPFGTGVSQLRAQTNQLKSIAMQLLEGTISLRLIIAGIRELAGHGALQQKPPRAVCSSQPARSTQ